jgi:hypothetical protein
VIKTKVKEREGKTGGRKKEKATEDLTQMNK